MKHLGFASITAVRQYLRYAQSKGIDPETVLEDCRLDTGILQRDNGRIRGEEFQKLLHQLVAVSEDPLMGLNSAHFVQPGSYNVLGYIAMSCATIEEAIQRIPPFERLVGDMGVTTITRGGDDILIDWHCAYTDPSVRPHMIDNVLASWVGYARWLSNNDTAPRRILLERESPGESQVISYRRFFGCPITFGQAHNRIVLPQSLLKMPLRQPDRQLRETLEQHANTQLQALEDTPRSFSTRVIQAIQSQLDLGVARKELIAEALHVTPRTLQRKLTEEGSRYQDLLDTVRESRARACLQDQNLSIQDIAYNLGFADGRSFHRSFKKWTGQTPGAFREHHLTAKDRRNMD